MIDSKTFVSLHTAVANRIFVSNYDIHVLNLTADFYHCCKRIALNEMRAV